MEKEKIYNQKLNKYRPSASASNIKLELLDIPPSELEGSENVIGQGRFGTVKLKYYRQSPVAVKYFEPSVTAKMVEREALILKECCHFNLPHLFGVSREQKPFMMIMQY